MTETGDTYDKEIDGWYCSFCGSQSYIENPPKRECLRCGAVFIVE